MTDLVIEQNNASISWGECVSAWINPYHDLEIRIKDIAKKNLLSRGDKMVLQFSFELAYGWTWPAGRITDLLKQLPKEHVQALIDDLLQHGNEGEIPKELEHYLNLLNQAALLDVSDLKTSQYAAQWFHSRSLIKDAFSTHGLKREGKALIKEFWIETKELFHHILEILIGILGINEIRPEKHSRYSDDQMSEYAAMSRWETYARLIGLPAVLFGIIYTYVEFKAVAAAITAVSVIALIAFAIAYQRYWKPCPKEQYGLKNLTLEMLHSQDPVYVRHDILRKVDRAFMEKKGVILVGEPGSGKSSIPRSLVQQIEERKYCPHIKYLFTCGASKFKGNGFDAVSLDPIAERYKNYKGIVSFFFDEFAAFFKPQGALGTNKADDIKMFCEDFTNIIGATTTDEFKKYIEKAARHC